MNRRRLAGVDDESDDENGVASPVAEPATVTADQTAGDDDEEESEGTYDGSNAGDDDDSSEEEEDDEQEMEKVREGFIVDDDDGSDDDDDSDSDSSSRRRRRRKRSRSRRTPDEEDGLELDEDDLDLVREAAGQDEPEGKKFKRLKRVDQRAGGRKGLTAMFSDEEAEGSEEEAPISRHGTLAGEFDDFIEDEVSDEEALRRQEERETATHVRRQAGRPGIADLGTQLEGLDEEKIGEIYEIFGDGGAYDWALEREDDMEQGDGLSDGEDEERGDRPINLQDVFEPSELAARMLTAEDDAIRAEDMPERYQLLRQGLKHGYDLDNQEFQEKREWVTAAMVKEHRLLFAVKPELREPFGKAVVKVLEFIAFERLEVPFIWHHRQDYLVNVVINSNGQDEASATSTEQLLTRDDLWRIVMLDMDFHAIIEKRKATQELWESLEVKSSDYDELVSQASTLVEYQDVMDWIQFRYSAELRARGSEAVKRHSRFGVYDRLRASPLANLAQLTGVDASKFALNIQAEKRLTFVDDPSKLPNEVAAEQAPDLEPETSLAAVTDYLSQELFHHPQIRRYVRNKFIQEAKIDIVLTDDGRKRIDENSKFARIKYAINWSFEELRLRPDLYLTMLAAEQQGLVVVRVQYPQYKTTLFERLLTSYLFSDGVSEVATQWNELRRSVFKQASRKIIPLIARNIREDLRHDCLRSLFFEVRKAFSEKLNQAPFKPPGFLPGTVPRVLAVSAGEGQYRDAVLAVVLDEDGNVVEHAKLGDMRDAAFRSGLAELAKRREVDVIGVGGWTGATRRLFQQVSEIVSDEGITVGENQTPLEVRYVNDEVARLYQSSKRAEIEYTDLVPVARYCVGLARYMQSPLLEYTSLGNEIGAVQIHPNQSLLPKDLFLQCTESCFVDYVCLDGIDINLAVRSPYVANAVPYIAGLGPRKASGMLTAIQSRGGIISNRTKLIITELTPKTIFMNCASFFKIPQDTTASKEDDSDVLDGTRIHPEDYELARKMVGDALELDEEDIAAYERSGRGGVVAQLDDPDRLDELILEDYAMELEKSFKQKKLCTLQNIRDELKDNYRELRAPLKVLTDREVFTMLTGHSPDSFKSGAVVSAICRRVTNRQLVLSVDGGVDGVAESGNISDDRSQPVSAQFTPGQAVQAVVQNVDYKALFAGLNTRASIVKRALEEEAAANRSIDPEKWNTEAEKRDIAAADQKIAQEQRQGRIIKHPLFRLFSAKQAEEYLAPLQRGDLVIRPSSRGNDHITITWKVADMLYQHIDVIELDKPNEYTIGRTLMVGRWKYSDLDELIIMHIQAMARKVDEMTRAEKFQSGTKADVDKWLTAYTNARPNKSVYAFCFDHKRPGYFLLCFKTGANADVQQWHVKVIPNGYELMNNSYPDVPSLCNGFKMIFAAKARTA